MRQVHADIVATGSIGKIFCFDLDRAAIGSQQEVMGRGSLLESHPFFAAFPHLGMRIMTRTFCWRVGFLSILCGKSCCEYGDKDYLHGSLRF